MAGLSGGVLAPQTGDVDRATALSIMEQRFGVTPAAFAQVESLFARKVLRKRQHLVTVNQNVSYFAVVVSGLLRIYYVTQQGKEATKMFREAGELIGPFAELLRGQPSRTATQALEPSVVLVAPFQPFLELAEKDLFWSNVMRRVLAQNFLEKDDREYDLLQLSAEERYQKLLATRPGWVKKIRQYQLASYLGVTPVGLSRIRRRLMEGGAEEEGEGKA